MEAMTDAGNIRRLLAPSSLMGENAPVMASRVDNQSEPEVGRKSGPRLGSFYIRGCLQGAVKRGYDPLSILRAAGIDPSAYDDPFASLDGVQLQRLFVTTSNVMNDVYLGFTDIQAKPRMSFLAAVEAIRCETFGEGIKSMAKFVNAVRSDVDVRVKANSNQDQVELRYQSSGFADGIEPHLVYWFETYWFYKFLCWLVGRPIQLDYVQFQGSAPDCSIDYSLLFDCPIRFAGEAGGMYFAKEYLKLPIVRSEAELRGGDFVNECEDWFQIPRSEQSFGRRVEQLVMDLCREGGTTPTLQVLSDILGLSPRTISRRLHREDTSFQDIKNKVRRELAEELLRTTELSISKIAERVGFWEPADFTRAYTHWTGMTPTEFRAQRQG